MIQVSPKEKSRINSEIGKILSYNEVVQYLDAHQNPSLNLKAITQINSALGNIAQKLNAITIAGTNGKSITQYFTVKLLNEEGIQAGAFATSHFLSYNERFQINQETIANNQFTDIANEIISLCETEKIKASTQDILVGMALKYFYENKVDVVITENSTANLIDPITIIHPKIAAITRIITSKHDSSLEHDVIRSIISTLPKNCHFVSADQSKLNLQCMHTISEEKGLTWHMPLRKLAPLAYPFAQLHGRCAALAERIAQLYMQNIVTPTSVVLQPSLLNKPKGQRGRPTIQAKRQSEMYPKKTLEKFWQDVITTLPNRFELLETEKPAILLDNASNLDAFENLFLGIRLLHYQKPLKGLTLILACKDKTVDEDEFIKALRYFFKKTSGSVIFCKLTNNSWDVEKMVNYAKNAKIKAKSAVSYEEAFDLAIKSIDEKNGLVVISGSQEIITAYRQTHTTSKS